MQNIDPDLRALQEVRDQVLRWLHKNPVPAEKVLEKLTKAA